MELAVLIGCVIFDAEEGMHMAEASRSQAVVGGNRKLAAAVHRLVEERTHT